MQYQKNLEFDFKKRKLDFSINTKETVDFVAMETLQIQLVGVLFNCLMIVFLTKTLNVVELFPLFFLMAKIGFIGNSISQAFKYLKEKDIKNQLVNGFMNVGLFYYFFMSSGFNDTLSLTTKAIKLLFT